MGKGFEAGKRRLAGLKTKGGWVGFGSKAVETAMLPRRPNVERRKTDPRSGRGSSPNGVRQGGTWASVEGRGPVSNAGAARVKSSDG